MMARKILRNVCLAIVLCGTIIMASCDSSGGVNGRHPEEVGGQVDTTVSGGTETDDPKVPGPVELKHRIAFWTDAGVYTGYISDLSSIKLLPGTAAMTTPFSYSHSGNLLLSGPRRSAQSWKLSDPPELEAEFSFGTSVWSPRMTHGFGEDKVVLNTPDHVQWIPDVSLWDLNTGERMLLYEGATPIGVATGGRVVTLHGEGALSDSAYVRLFNPATKTFESGPLYIPRLETVLFFHTTVAHYRADKDVLVVSAWGRSTQTGESITAVYVSEGFGPLEMVFAASNNILSVYAASRDIIYASLSGDGSGWRLIRIDARRRDNAINVVLPSESVPEITSVRSEVIFDG